MRRGPEPRDLMLQHDDLAHGPGGLVEGVGERGDLAAAIVLILHIHLLGALAAQPHGELLGGILQILQLPQIGLDHRGAGFDILLILIGGGDLPSLDAGANPAQARQIGLAQMRHRIDGIVGAVGPRGHGTLHELFRAKCQAANDAHRSPRERRITRAIAYERETTKGTAKT